MVSLNHKNNDEDYSIEITPLVDVVFLLLIFFLLTASYINPSMEMNLPEAQTSSLKDHTKACTITIARDGDIEINERPSSIADIKTIPEDKEIIILEDKEGPYGVFIEVLDALRLGGISRISIVTEEKTD
ncbi:MAG: biopolymer transporter ExbD [Thermodesulfobacteriota bacterium]|nr:biopolymer transporter ExbD [Thermodesulfobacteriota bacterium]